MNTKPPSMVQDLSHSIMKFAAEHGVDPVTALYLFQCHTIRALSELDHEANKDHLKAELDHIEHKIDVNQLTAQSHAAVGTLQEAFHSRRVQLYSTATTVH